MNSVKKVLQSSILFLILGILCIAPVFAMNNKGYQGGLVMDFNDSDDDNDQEFDEGNKSIENDNTNEKNRKVSEIGDKNDAQNESNGENINFIEDDQEEVQRLTALWNKIDLCEDGVMEYIDSMKNVESRTEWVLTVFQEGGDDQENVQAKFPKKYKDKTILMLACKKGYFKAVKRLIEEGASINIKGASNVTALAYAIEGCFVDIVKLLVQNSVDIIDCGASDMPVGSALELALYCKSNRREIVEALLQNSSIDSKYKTKALSSAACKGYDDIVQLLLEHGASICDHNNNALVEAVYKNHGNIVKILLRHHLVKYITQEQMNKALFSAYDRRMINVELIKLLINKGAQIDAIVDRKSILMRLIDGGCGENVQDYLNRSMININKIVRGYTPLMYAVISKKTAMIELVLNNGADPDIIDDENLTASDIARNKITIEIADFLAELSKEYAAFKKNPLTTTQLGSPESYLRMMYNSQANGISYKTLMHVFSMLVLNDKINDQIDLESFIKECGVVRDPYTMLKKHNIPHTWQECLTGNNLVEFVKNNTDYTDLIFNYLP